MPRRATTRLAVNFNEWSAGRHDLAVLHVDLADDARRRGFEGLSTCSAARIKRVELQLSRFRVSLGREQIAIGGQVIAETLLRLREVLFRRG